LEQIKETVFFFQHNYSTSSYGSAGSHTDSHNYNSGVGMPRSYPNRQPQVGHFQV